MRATGIDVSHHHPIIDWDKLLATDISFVGIKATQGLTFTDPWLVRHRDGARAQGDRLALVAYYHFAGAHEPADEAAHLLRAVGELQPNERLALDVEGDDAPDIDWVEAFVAALPADRRHLVYTSDRIWKQIGNPAWDRATNGAVDCWLPRYNASLKEPAVPAPWAAWTFWQFSESLSIPGVSGPCDANYFRGDLAELQAYAALQPAG